MCCGACIHAHAQIAAVATNESTVADVDANVVTKIVESHTFRSLGETVSFSGTNWVKSSQVNLSIFLQDGTLYQTQLVNTRNLWCNQSFMIGKNHVRIWVCVIFAS